MLESEPHEASSKADALELLSVIFNPVINFDEIGHRSLLIQLGLCTQIQMIFRTEFRDGFVGVAVR